MKLKESNGIPADRLGRKKSHNDYTHCEIIQFRGLRAIRCGVPDECNHDFSGEVVHITQSGRVLRWNTYPRYASFTAQARDEILRSIHDKDSDDPIVCGTVTCKHCGLPFSPPQY